MPLFLTKWIGDSINVRIECQPFGTIRCLPAPGGVEDASPI